MTTKLEIALDPHLVARAKELASEQGKDVTTYLSEQVIGLARGDDRLADAVSRLRAPTTHADVLRNGIPRYGRPGY